MNPTPSSSDVSRITKRSALLITTALLCCITALGCQDDPAQDPSDSPDTPAPPSSPDPTQPAPNQPLQDAASLYQAQCAICHGPRGEGGIGSPLQNTTLSRDALVRSIDVTMPPANPALCQGECAERLADYILAGLDTSPTCDPQARAIAPRRMRLLNRREYNQTIRDLFSPYLGSSSSPQGAACGDVSGCMLGAETCQTGRCQPLSCNTFAFILEPPSGRAPSTVHVAGSFNGWPGSIAAGGLPLRYEPAINAWYAEAPLPEGRHLYKFVLDERDWITDPRSSEREDDGFGGQNSALRITCEAGNTSPTTPSNALAALQNTNWSADLPNEQRGAHFSYDNSVESLFVTSQHLDAYLKNAEALSQLAAELFPTVASCQERSDACARAFITRFGERAWRRPLREAEVTRYVTMFMEEEQAQQGAALVARAMLVSPHFLYRAELGQAQDDGTYKLTQWEIASALSYFYWGTMPDEALFEAARRGQLEDAAARREHAERLLNDARSDAMLAVFVTQWLRIERVATQAKNQSMFSTFDDAMRRAMLEETQRFFIEVMRSGTGRYGELFTADYTFARGPLAQHYGITGAPSGLSRVQLPAERRAGLLGHGSVLTATAHSDQTSPVLRGLMLRESVLCQEFPAPPANAGNVPDISESATTRQRFAQHSEDPSCNSCHQYIDPVGFGFERFDAVGRWRTSESGQPIDASGDLNDIEGFGTRTSGVFDTLPQLGAQVAQSQSGPRCLTQQVYRFQMGFKERAEDTCVIAKLGDQFLASGGDLRELWLSIPAQSDWIYRR